MLTNCNSEKPDSNHLKDERNVDLTFTIWEHVVIVRSNCNHHPVLVDKRDLWEWEEGQGTVKFLIAANSGPDRIGFTLLKFGTKWVWKLTNWSRDFLTDDNLNLLFLRNRFSGQTGHAEMRFHITVHSRHTRMQPLIWNFKLHHNMTLRILWRRNYHRCVH